MITIFSEKGGFDKVKNGSGQAIFYRCVVCNQLVAVGAELSGHLKGALNSHLLDDQDQLGETIAIRPRFLAAQEKLARWSKIWGTLKFE